MMVAMPFRSRRLAVSLGALALVGLAILATLDTRSATAPPMADAPACTSCDARHAGLANLREKEAE
jgi:hypothetical protein